MFENGLLFQLQKLDLDRLVENAEKGLKDQGDRVPAPGLLKQSISRVVEDRLDLFAEGLAERFANVSSDEFRALQRILNADFYRQAKLEAMTVSIEAASQGILFEERPSILNGYRIFAPDRFEAMIEYIAYRGKDIFQTNLNKLLFYTDFGFFHLAKMSMSGATYKRLPRGPVNDQYRNILNSMEKRGKLRMVRIKTRGTEARLLKPKKTYNPTKTILSEDEKKMLNWTINRLGNLRSDEISELSHNELAFKNTAKGGPISYAFAENLKILPPNDLLD